MSIQSNRQVLTDAQAKGPVSTLGAYFRLSGPGWLQSAITLGGGSLGGALYLGMLGGTHLLWLQLVAIVIGVIMLSAISFVTLSTGKRPYAAINEYVNPVLGVGWIVATILANMIWIMPQFSLCFDSLDKSLEVTKDTVAQKQIVSAIIGVLALAIVTLSFRPGWMAKLFDWLLKLMVAFVVICFVGVVVLLFRNGFVNWNEILTGFIPNLLQWNSASPELTAAMQDMPASVQEYWNSKIIASQRNSMIGVTATAVGLNMTFLLPYSMLARGWDRPFRGLARFDLITGMAIPYLLVTSCIVIASAHAFHAKADLEFLSNDPEEVVSSKLFDGTQSILEARMTKSKFDAALDDLLTKPLGEQIDLLEAFESERADDQNDETAVEQLTDQQKMAQRADQYAMVAQEKWQAEFAELGKSEQKQQLSEFAVSLSENERKLAVTLVKPNAKQLASSLVPLLGERGANQVFGLGALAMGFSTIIILMLINGYAVAEIAGHYDSTPWRVFGALAAGVVGFLWWWIWADTSKTWLIIVASTFGAILLPIAYVSFFALMNNKRLLGDDKPRGIRMAIWNVLLIIGVVGAFAQAILAGMEKVVDPERGAYVIGGLVTFGVLVLVGFSARFRSGQSNNTDTGANEQGGGMDSSG